MSMHTWGALLGADVDLVVDDLGVWLEEQMGAHARSGDLAMAAVCGLALAAYEMRGATSFEDAASASVEIDAAIETLREVK